MVVTTPESVRQRDPAPFAASLVLPVATVVAVAHLIAAAAGRQYWFDEVYMLALGRNHLEWGSADQPPVTPALAALADTVLPGNVVVLRFPAIIATAVAVVLVALIARELGGDRRTQGVAAIAQATCLWPAFAGHWLTPYALEAAQWLLMIWLLVRWVRTRQDRLLLICGVVVGLAALTKFQVLLLCVVLLGSVAVSGPRALLWRPALWAGAVTAAAISVPTLLWQAAHGWPQLAMSRVVAGEAAALYAGRPGIAVQLVLYAGVIGTGLLLYGTWVLVRTPQLRDYRFLAITFVALYVLFVVTEGRPYYLAGLYGPLIAAGAMGLQLRRERGRPRRNWPAGIGVALGVASTVALLIVSVRAVDSPVPDQIAARTAVSLSALPPEQRRRTAVIGESYIIAAYLDGYSDRHDLPRAYSLNRSYGYLEPPPETQDDALYVGAEPGVLGAYFRTVRQVGQAGDDIPIWLLTGRNTPWAQIWDTERTLTVT